MTDNGTLFDRLATWKEHGSNVNASHLDEVTLYQLTAEGSLAEADSAALKHLSLCSTCMGEWANWRRARGAAENTEGPLADIDLSFGFLQAAASPELTESISMQSQCGSYRLDILPQEGAPDRGLVVFEALSGNERLEDAQVTIHDREGRLLLKGRLREGRLARPLNDPSQFDLSTWTVSIDTDRADLT